MWRRCLLFILPILYTLWLPAPVFAQFWPSVGGRAVSRDGKWLAPVANPVISSDENDHLARGSVDAWDLTVPLGSPVYPMAEGRVEYAGCNNAGGYGCWALIQHDGGFTSVYAHLMDEGAGTIWVKSGEKVTQWSVLGRVGWTGKTSFGPHTHWEIRQTSVGHVRNDQFFSRGAITYCKFCQADSTAVTPENLPPLTGMAYYTNRLLSPQALAGVAIFAVALLLFLRPEVAVLAAHTTGALLRRLVNFTGEAAEDQQQWGKRHWAYLSTILVAPALMCGTATAFTVWMADEGITPSALMVYVRYGVYPLLGGGYQSGAQYSAVWGMPCSGVGSLGNVCTPDKITQAGLDWQQQIELVTGIKPAPVVIPRLSGQFGLDEAGELLSKMHRQEGLVILDTSNDYPLARRAIDELAPLGIDGVAIDLEFVHNVEADDLRALAQHLADQRKAAGLRGEGVLVLWNVFHNIEQDADLAVEGVRIVPIFTGYGSAAAKIAGLTTTQKLFNVAPADSGLMAFDNRWPVNAQCSGFDTRRGYDCQNWLTLFADPKAQEVGWWVQQ